MLAEHQRGTGGKSLRADGCPALYPPAMPLRKPTHDSGVDRAAELVRGANARVHETAAERDRPGGMERWHAALHDLDQAMRLLYPPSFSDDVVRLRKGDLAAVETAIRFLEADPYAFGTGYAKEDILRRLRRLDLSPKQRSRLVSVILRRVDQGDRREFRQYCLLAPAVIDDTLRSGLHHRLRSGESGRVRRALWVLDALGEPLESGDRAIARGVIEAIAGSKHWWEQEAWLRVAVKRYGERAWLDELMSRSSMPGKAGEAAAFLLTLAGRQLTPDQRRSLEARFAVDMEGKLGVIAAASGFTGPTADIDLLLADIEAGYGPVVDR